MTDPTPICTYCGEPIDDGTETVGIPPVARHILCDYRARHEGLRALLREVEWMPTAAGIRVCYYCHAYRLDGHASDCELKAALEGRDG